MNQGEQVTENYTYDAVGNRLSSLGVPYGYNVSNEMTAAGNATFIYDANGNTLTKTAPNGTTTYAWDFENRLTSVMLPKGSVLHYQYDPFGRRIESDGTGRIFVYDGDNVIEDLDLSGKSVARYTQGLGIDEPLEETASGAASYYEADGLGSITSLTGASGAIANTYSYDSFGNQTASTGSVSNRFFFTARESVAKAGLLYYRARFYDPSVGRFLSEDPIGLRSQQTNLFEYVFNDPARWTDPSGLKVYLCDRPAVLNFGGINVNAFDVISHYWIKTDTKEAGLGRTGHGVPGQGQSDYFGVPTSINDHSGASAEPGAHCKEMPDEDESCVNKELTIGKPMGRFFIWPPGATCKSVATDILERCSTKPKPPIKIPFNPAGPSGGFLVP